MLCIRPTLLLFLLAFSQCIYANPKKRVLEADEIFAIIHTVSEDNIRYNNKTIDDAKTKQLNELLISTCRASFATDLAIDLLTSDSKNIEDRVDYEAARNRLIRVNLKELESKLQLTCKSISTAGKAKAVVTAALEIMSNEAKSKLALKRFYSDRAKMKRDISLSQIDLIGLVPGKSQKSEVDKIATRESIDFCNPMCLEIGGYKLKCDDEYDDNGNLSRLTCWFGENRSNGERSQVYQVLKDGFINKLGQPALTQSDTLQKAFGASFDREVITWRDKLGNTLEIHSRAGRIDRGGMALNSFHHLQKQQQDAEAKSKERRF